MRINSRNNICRSNQSNGTIGIQKVLNDFLIQKN